ncbi:MAG: RNA polymerase sigma factor WhiG, partial [Candidatus Latescibacterota bacterium]
EEANLEEVLRAPGEDPSESAERREMEELLMEAIRSLPERHREVIVLYYYEGLTLKEIGEVLGVSDSRVSQLHSEALLRLRAKIRRYMVTEAM